MMRIYLSFRHENDDEAEGHRVSPEPTRSGEPAPTSPPTIGGRRRSGQWPWWERSDGGSRLSTASR